MTAPLFLAAYALGAAFTLAGLALQAGYRGKEADGFLIGAFFAALTWPVFWVAFIGWKIGKALRGKR